MAELYPAKALPAAINTSTKTPKNAHNIHLRLLLGEGAGSPGIAGGKFNPSSPFVESWVSSIEGSAGETCVGWVAFTSSMRMDGESTGARGVVGFVVGSSGCNEVGRISSELGVSIPPIIPQRN